MPGLTPAVSSIPIGRYWLLSGPLSNLRMVNLVSLVPFFW